MDLAGSERQKKTNATGDRLKEGAQINQSLTTLALVIHALAKHQKTTRYTTGQAQDPNFIPFRNSKLTFLLQESLVGNSKTVMIAAVSPARSNFEETMSTLRFANSVKEIQTKAMVNQESDHAIIASLRREIEALKENAGKANMQLGGNVGANVQSWAAAEETEGESELRQLHELCGRYGCNFAEELEAAAQMEEIRGQALRHLGLGGANVAKIAGLDANTPYLMNVADDPCLTGCLAYFIPVGEDVTLGSDPKCTITLRGLGVAPVMCKLRNEDHRGIVVTPVVPVSDSSEEFPVSEETSNLLFPTNRNTDEENNKRRKKPPRLCVNGRLIPGTQPRKLENKDRFLVGRSSIFKVVVPLAQKEERARYEANELLQANKEKDSNMKPQDSMEEHLAEVVDFESEEFEQARMFVEGVANRIGDEAAESFLQAFGKALPLVHEANDITEALRREDNLVMRLDVAQDVLAFEASDPMLCVRLWKKESAIAKLRRVAKLVKQTTQINRHLHSVSFYLTGGAGISGQEDMFTDGVVDGTRVQLLGVWSWRNFLTRLSGMREAYDEFVQTQEQPQWRTDDLDPWGEVSFLDVRHRLTVAGAARGARGGRGGTTKRATVCDGDLGDGVLEEEEDNSLVSALVTERDALAARERAVARERDDLARRNRELEVLLAEERDRSAMNLRDRSLNLENGVTNTSSATGAGGGSNTNSNGNTAATGFSPTSRASAGNNLSAGGGNSSPPRAQEAKVLATELLAALRSMKQELHAW